VQNLSTRISVLTLLSSLFWLTES